MLKEPLRAFSVVQGEGGLTILEVSVASVLLSTTSVMESSGQPRTELAL